MSHEISSSRRVHIHPEGSTLLSDAMVNVVKGVVHSPHMNVFHTTIRIRTGRRVDMRITLPINDDRCFIPGQPVIDTIPAEAVHLEACLFRRSRQRLNRCYGRIVLIKPLDEGQLTTAKLHGEGWTLSSTIPAWGSTSSFQTWDLVNIVVDPHRIKLFPSQSGLPSHGKSADPRENLSCE